MINKTRKPVQCMECQELSLQPVFNHGICHSCDEEVSVCEYCDSPSEEHGCGDESWSFCAEGCGLIEGHTKDVKISHLIKIGKY